MAEFSQELFDTMMQRIASGESIAQICRDDDMPSTTAFYNWLNKSSDLVDRYTRARETQADAIFDEILEIADDATNDFMERRSERGEAGDGWEANHEHMNRSRLRIDARKWVAARLAPKKYGDKLDLNHGGKVENKTTVDATALPTSALEALIEARKHTSDE